MKQREESIMLMFRMTPNGNHMLRLLTHSSQLIADSSQLTADSFYLLTAFPHYGNRSFAAAQDDILPHSSPQ